MQINSVTAVQTPHQSKSKLGFGVKLDLTEMVDPLLEGALKTMTNAARKAEGKPEAFSMPEMGVKPASKELVDAWASLKKHVEDLVPCGGLTTGENSNHVIKVIPIERVMGRSVKLEYRIPGIKTSVSSEHIPYNATQSNNKATILKIFKEHVNFLMEKINPETAEYIEKMRNTFSK